MRKDIADVVALVDESAAECVVVGHPVGLSGTATAQTHHAERFAKFLGEELSIPVELWDERYSTSIATAITGNDQKTREAGRRDAVAAAIILQGYLDHRERSSDS